MRLVELTVSTVNATSMFPLSAIKPKDESTLHRKIISRNQITSKFLFMFAESNLIKLIRVIA